MQVLIAGDIFHDRENMVGASASTVPQSTPSSAHRPSGGTASPRSGGCPLAGPAPCTLRSRLPTPPCRLRDQYRMNKDSAATQTGTRPAPMCSMLSGKWHSAGLCKWSQGSCVQHMINRRAAGPFIQRGILCSGMCVKLRPHRRAILRVDSAHPGRWSRPSAGRSATWRPTGWVRPGPPSAACTGGCRCHRPHWAACRPVMPKHRRSKCGWAQAVIGTWWPGCMLAGVSAATWRKMRRPS